jgi:hypothetical protein
MHRLKVTWVGCVCVQERRKAAGGVVVPSQLLVFVLSLMNVK